MCSYKGDLFSLCLTVCKGKPLFKHPQIYPMSPLLYHPFMCPSVTTHCSVNPLLRPSTFVSLSINRVEHLHTVCAEVPRSKRLQNLISFSPTIKLSRFNNNIPVLHLVKTEILGIKSLLCNLSISRSLNLSRIYFSLRT